MVQCDMKIRAGCLVQSLRRGLEDCQTARRRPLAPNSPAANRPASPTRLSLSPMSRVGGPEANAYCAKPPGQAVAIPFNTNERPQLEDLLEWNGYWAKCVNSYSVSENEDKPQNVMWFGCMDASCSEVFSTLTLPGGILTYRNFGNLFQTSDPSAKAAIAQALTQNIAIAVVGHDNCRAIRLAKELASSPGDATLTVPGDIKDWLKPLIQLVQDNPTATLERLAELNVKQQVESILDYLEPTYRSRSFVNVVNGYVYNFGTGILRA